MSSVHPIKKQLRHQMKARLATTPVAELSASICRHLSSMPPLISGGVWGGFYPLPGEPDIKSIYLRGQWAFPKTESNLNMYYALGASQVVTHPEGFNEPMGGTISNYPELVGILVPGLAFDQRGQRLGRGRGYFDRYLSHFQGLKVGVCFEFQVVEQVPIDPWDQPLDYLVTDHHIYDFRKVA